MVAFITSMRRCMAKDFNATVFTSNALICLVTD
jgi:hypothetical protein